MLTIICTHYSGLSFFNSNPVLNHLFFVPFLPKSAKWKFSSSSPKGPWRYVELTCSGVCRGSFCKPAESCWPDMGPLIPCQKAATDARHRCQPGQGIGHVVLGFRGLGFRVLGV